MKKKATFGAPSVYLFGRFCREIAGLVVFYVVIRAVGRGLLTPEQITYAAPFVFFLIWVPRLGAAVSRFILAPKQNRITVWSILMITGRNTCIAT